MVGVSTTVFLGEFETKTLLEVEPRGPGTYPVKMMVRCNSLLSSIYIKAADAGATIKANYFDTTTGDEFTGERYDLSSHLPYGPANAGETHRLLVTKIHNKPQLEVIVTGGNVEFGVYATAVSSSASDVDSALVSDGDTFAPETNKAIPMACLDVSTGLLNFVTCPLKVEITGQGGDLYHIRGGVDADPGNTVTVLTDTVPTGTERRFTKLWVTATNDGYFSLLANGVEIAAGRIDVVQHNVAFRFDPVHTIGAGISYELKYSSDDDPTEACPIIAFLTGFDVTL